MNPLKTDRGAVFFRLTASGHYLGLLTLAWLVLLALPGASLAQENHAPGMPGPIQVAEVTAHSARISWGAATDIDGDVIAYWVSVRTRIEGIAQPWSAARNTHATSLIWDGLLAGTLYEVRVSASDGKATSDGRIKEQAFITLHEIAANNPPSLPSAIEIAQVTAHGARLSWGAATDHDGDAIAYLVSLRKRVEGVAQDWLPARDTHAVSLVWDGLEPETLYEVRVRASDGKSFSNWLIKEAAFQTLTETGTPTKPGEITVDGVAARSARIAWVPSTGPAGVKVSYEIQLRQRLGGVAQAWHGAGETTNAWLAVDGLTPGTVYEVQVRAWAAAVASAWTVKENAFTTLAGAEVNHPPSLPGAIEISKLTPRSVQIAWGPSPDPEGDQVTYSVSLRKRIEGVAQSWLPAHGTRGTSLSWDGLSPNTLYEIRIRASDGKSFSDWRVKENAFRTPVPETLIGSVEGSIQPGSTPNIVLAWPNASGAGVLEATDSLLSPNWTRCQEVETDGTLNQATIPTTATVKFFRVR